MLQLQQKEIFFMDLTKNILFKGISGYDCGRMLKCMNPYEKVFRANETISRFDHSNDTIGVIISGSASIVRYDVNGNKTILEQLSENSIFGECLAFANLTDDGVTIYADSECTVSFIKYDQITKRCSNACARHTRLVENLFYMISMKTLNLSERVEILSQRSIRSKIMCCFNINAMKSGKNSFELPFSLSSFADYICVDRCAMMREIKKLKDEGIIDINKKNVKLLEQ